MQVQSLFIQVTSTDPDRLFAFYRDVVGLPVQEGTGAHSLDICGATLGIDTHSETTGPAREPTRVMLDLFVADVKAERERLEAAGVTFIRKEGKEAWGGVISTFVDPDGNYAQIIEFRPPEGAATA